MNSKNLMYFDHDAIEMIQHKLHTIECKLRKRTHDI